MSKFAIYRKDGSILRESKTAHNSDGAQVFAEKVEYNGSWMGECFLIITVKSAYPINFQVGDYVMYRGEKFVLNGDASVVKKARRGSYGEGFTYDSIKFSALHYELTDINFLDYVLADNQIHYTALPVFPFYAASVEDYCDRLQANTNRYCESNGFALSDYWMFITPSKSRTVQRLGMLRKNGSTWEGISSSVAQGIWDAAYPNGTSTDDEKKDVSVSVSNQTIWESLALIKDSFGLNFINRGRQVIVGGAGLPTSIFQYGKGNGLYEIERVADSDQKIITKLFAYGSEKNMPVRYYANIGKQCYAKMYSRDADTGESRVYLDLVWASRYFTNNTTTPVSSLETFGVTIEINDTAYDIEVYPYDVGLRTLVSFTAPASINANLTTNTKIYFTQGIDKDKWPPSLSEYVGVSDGVPNNMAVSKLMLPGFPAQSLYDWVLANGGTAVSDSNNNSLYGKATWHEHTAFFSKDKYQPYVLSPNFVQLGIREQTEIFDGSDGNDEIYPTIEATVGGVDVNTISAAETIMDNGIFGDTEPDLFSLTLSSLGAGFDLKTLAGIGTQDGGTPTISMKDGHCGGRSFEFEAKNVTRNNDNTHTVLCKREHDTLLDLWFPYSYNASINEAPTSNEVYQVRAGDKYVLTGIPMNDTYISIAAASLLESTLTLLEKNDYVRYTFSPKVDEIYMAHQHDYYLQEYEEDEETSVRSLYLTMKEGDIMRFTDSDLLIDGSIFIDTLRIKENGNVDIPTYEVTLRNDKVVGTIQRIQEQINSITSGTASIIGGLSRNDAVDIVSGEGGKRFLSKITNDIAQGVITFVRGIISNAMSYFSGITITGQGHVTSPDIRSDETPNDDNIGGYGYHVYKDGQSNGHVCTDYLDVRKKARFTELEIRRLSYINAENVQSMAASKVVAVLPIGQNGSVLEGEYSDSDVWAWRCLVLEDDGTTATTNGWQVGDQARCQSFNIKSGVHQNVGNRYYWRLVIRIGEGYEYGEKTYYWFELAATRGNNPAFTYNDNTTLYAQLKTRYEQLYPNATDGATHVFAGWEDDDDLDNPAAEDTIVQMGNQIDTDRMGFFITKADNLNTGPYIYAGVNQFSLVDKMVTKITPAEVLISARKLKVFSDPNAGDASPLTHYRGDWTDGSTSYYYDEWDYNGSRWLCLYQGAEGITCAPGEMPSNAPQGATVADYWKQISLKGDSEVTVYKQSATQPATPTGNTIPPTGWHKEPKWFASGEILGEGERGAFNVRTITFTTTKVNQKIRVRLEASSEDGFDFIICGAIDEELNSEVVNGEQLASDEDGLIETYHATTGTDVNEFVLTASSIGEHFIQIAYTKDRSSDYNDDLGRYWVGFDNIAIWASVATFNGDTKISGWSTPVRWNGEDGQNGADGVSIPTLYIKGTTNTGSSSSEGLVRLFNGTTTIEKKFNDATSVSGYSGNRGILLVTIKRSDLTIEDCLVYDTYAPDPNNNTPAGYGDVANASVNARYALYLKLNNLSSDYIVCLVSQDACGWSDRLQAQLKAFGGRTLDVTTTGRYAFAFIGIKGLPEGYAQQIQSATAQVSPVELSSQIIDGAITTVKDGKDGQDGLDGLDGQDGDDGDDGYTISLTPSTIIINQSEELDGNGQYPLIYTNAFGLLRVMKSGVGVDASVSVSLDGHTTVSKKWSKNSVSGWEKDNSLSTGEFKIAITAVSTNGTFTDKTVTPNVTRNKYYDSGRITITVTPTGATNATTLYLDYKCNLMGQISTTIKGDVEETVANKEYSVVDEDGNVVTTQTVGQYIRSSSQNTAKLTETIGARSNGNNLFGFSKGVRFGTFIPFVQGYGIVSNTSSDTQLHQAWVNNLGFDGKTGYYVVTCEAKMLGGSSKDVTFSLWGTGTNDNPSSVTKTVGTTWTKLTMVFYIASFADSEASRNGQFYIDNIPDTNRIAICKLQIEHGSVPSDFGVCKEDEMAASVPVSIDWSVPSAFTKASSGGPDGGECYYNNTHPASGSAIEINAFNISLPYGVYTMSFWAKANVDEYTIQCICGDVNDYDTNVMPDLISGEYGVMESYQESGMNRYGSVNIKLSTQWRKYYVPYYLASAGNMYIVPMRINYGYTGGSSGTFYISKIKFEKGYVTSANRTEYQTVMKQTAHNIDFSVLVNSMEKAGIHLYTSNNTTPESEAEIDEGVIDLVAGKVNFKSSNGAVNPYMSIDQNGKLIVDSITATNGDFSGTIHAISGDFTDLTSQDGHVAIVGTPNSTNYYWRGLAVGDDPVNGDGDLATIGGRFTDASASTGYGYLVIAKNTGSGSLAMVTIDGNDGSVGCGVLKTQRIETNLAVATGNYVCDSGSFVDSKVVCNYSGTRTIKLPLATTAREIWVRQIGTGTTNVYDALETTLVGSVTKADGWKLFVYIPQTGWS